MYSQGKGEEMIFRNLLIFPKLQDGVFSSITLLCLSDAFPLGVRVCLGADFVWNVHSAAEDPETPTFNVMCTVPRAAFGTAR